MRVLVTGGSGFIGHHLVQHLLQTTTWHVIVLDSLSYAGDPFKLYASDAWREASSDRARILFHDLRAPVGQQTAEQIGPVDAIINLASWSHVDRSIEDPVPFVRNNVDLALNLLEYARKLPGLRLFLQFSTDEVYGPAYEDQKHVEWSPIIPSNPYAASKAAQEALAVAWWRTWKVPVLITNTMNVIGPEQHAEKYVPKSIRAILEAQPVPVHGELTGTGWEPGSRCWLYVKDAADAVRFLVHRWATMGGTDYWARIHQPPRLHIVGEEVSNLELASRIAKLLGKGWTMRWVDFHSSRPGHDRRYALDGSALAAMGWTAPYGLDRGLEETVAHYLEQGT